MTALSRVNLIPVDELFSPSVSLAVDTKKHKLDKLQSNWSSPIICVSLMSFCYREHSKPQSFALFPISQFQEMLKKIVLPQIQSLLCLFDKYQATAIKWLAQLTFRLLFEHALPQWFQHKIAHISWILVFAVTCHANKSTNQHHSYMPCFFQQ